MLVLPTMMSSKVMVVCLPVASAYHLAKLLQKHSSFLVYFFIFFIFFTRFLFWPLLPPCPELLPRPQPPLHPPRLLLVSKAAKCVGLLKRISLDAPRECLEILYKSMIRPILEYGDIFFDGRPDTYVKRLENVQRQAALMPWSHWRVSPVRCMYDMSF